MSHAGVLEGALPTRDPRPDVVETLFAGSLPAKLTPIASDCQLQVAVTWGRDHLLDLRAFGPGGRVSAGTGRDATFRVPHELLGESRELFVATGEGFDLSLPERAHAVIWRDGVRQRIEGPAGGVRLTLGRDDRVWLDLGRVHVVARCARTQPMGRRALAALLDLEFLSTITVLALAAVTFERMSQAASEGWVSYEDQLTKVAARYRQTIVRQERPPEPIKLKPAAQGARAPKPEGRFGQRNAAQREAARGERGGVNVDKRRADQAKVQQMMSWLTGGAAATANVLGRGGMGGINQALGGIKARGELGDAAGLDGRGTRDGGPGGGGKTIGIGGLTDRSHGPGRDPHGIDIGALKPTASMPPRSERKVEGGLTADEVDRVVRRHFNEVKYCYEKELQHDPNLDGKISVFFEVGPVGDVTVTNVHESTLASNAVEACVLSKVRLWKFPAPRGGGVVQVRYPFLFRSH